MENDLKYYYNIDAHNIKKSNKDYLFDFNQEKYILNYYEYDENKIKEIIEISNILYQKKIFVHKIINNIFNDSITVIDNKKYVLLKVIVKKFKINYNDILNFNIKVADGKCKWFSLWTKKIDYYEYQIQEFINKFPLIKDSFNYYIGLSEIAINLLNNRIENFDLYITHFRIYENSIDFYNPLNLIVDLKVRDMAEYVKKLFYKNYENEWYEKIIPIVYEYINKINNKDRYMFFVRMLYPTQYFDMYQNIIIDNIEEIRLNLYIKSALEYEKLLYYIYNQINFYIEIPEIKFIKEVIN